MLVNIQSIVTSVIGYIGNVLSACGTGATEIAKKIVGL